jgi:hypothetical protein
MKFGSFVFLTLSFFLGHVCALAQVMNAQQQQTSVAAPCRVELQEISKVFARRFSQQAWFSRNPSVVADLFAPTYLVHDIGDRKQLPNLRTNKGSPSRSGKTGRSRKQSTIRSLKVTWLPPQAARAPLLTGIRANQIT